MLIVLQEKRASNINPLMKVEKYVLCLPRFEMLSLFIF